MEFGLRRISGSTRQITACVIASLPVFMAGMVLGWPSPFMSYMTAGQVPVSLTSKQTSLMVTFIDVGNFAMAVPAGWLMDRIGRKFTINLSAPLMFVGWMFIMFGRQAWCLYVARLVQGTAVAIAWVVVPAYVGEMASIRIRGKLGLLVQVSYASGLLFSYTAGWLFEDYTTLTTASVCVTVVSNLLFMLLPESPYYLMLDGKPEDAAQCLWSLRSYTDSDLRSELVAVKNSVLNDRCKANVGDLLNRDRRPLAIALVLSVLQMACGASVLEAYASDILSKTEVSSNALAAFLGLVTLLAAVPFAIAVDRCGRRPLMIISCFGTTVCHVGIAYSLWLRSIGAATGWIPLFASMAGSQFFINIGIMPLLSVVQCEYFPSDTRAMADTTVVLTVTLSSIIVLTVHRTAVAYFYAYAAISFAGGVFCYAFMPETKCKSFVEIQTDFHRTESQRLSDERNCDYEQI